MRLCGPERFDPNVVDWKALEPVNALSDTWKPRRRAARLKWTSSANRKDSQSYAVRWRTGAATPPGTCVRCTSVS
ncbi:hypothetical protein ACVMB0_000077 [Bradyrhizobium sp. USDA 4451]